MQWTSPFSAMRGGEAACFQTTLSSLVLIWLEAAEVRQRSHSHLYPPLLKLVLNLVTLEGARLSWPSLLGYTVRWYTCPKTVTHPSTNRVRYTVTLFIRRRTLPLALYWSVTYLLLLCDDRLQALYDDGVNGLQNLMLSARGLLLPSNSPAVSQTSICGMCVWY